MLQATMQSVTSIRPSIQMTSPLSASRRPLPFTGPSRGSLRCRAEVSTSSPTTSSPIPIPAPAATSSGMTFKQTPPLVWSAKDKENIRDVFSFAGPLPERVNGRLAMWAFAAIALGEFSNHTPALEQFSEGWVAAILFSMTITSASLIPKLTSGRPLSELYAAATSEGMDGEGLQQFLKLFTADLELLTGRVAMLGLVGLVAADLFKGDAFIG